MDRWGGRKKRGGDSELDWGRREVGKAEDYKGINVSRLMGETVGVPGEGKKNRMGREFWGREISFLPMSSCRLLLVRA